MTNIENELELFAKFDIQADYFTEYRSILMDQTQTPQQWGCKRNKLMWVRHHLKLWLQ